jgi:hypothetical protein
LRCALPDNDVSIEQGAVERFRRWADQSFEARRRRDLRSWPPSASALDTAVLAQEQSQRSTIKRAACDDPIVAAAPRLTHERFPKSQARKASLGIGTASFVQLGRVEISKADLDPLIRPVRWTDAEPITIADIAHDA